MTTKNEAMKLALGALSGSWRTEEEKSALKEKQIQAIIALRGALAEQPAQQEPLDDHAENEDVESLKRLLSLEASMCIAFKKENEQLLAANKDCINHFEALKADYDALIKGSADKGPWHVGVTRNDSRVYLQSDDFKHDVRLYINGDFADLEQHIEYAARLKRNMNGEDHPAQPQQEPVKIGRITDNINGMVLRQEVMLYTDDYLPIGTAVYTSPPQRTWVGLTDKEEVELWESTDSDWELMKRTEAKLKEKNT